jgi:branched-chain amino acid transport system substrate-binding protein
MEACNYSSAADRGKFVEAMEALETFEEGRNHPQGTKVFDARIHQSFGHQFISRVEGTRLNVVHRTSIDDGLYEAEADYTTMPL